MRTNGFLQYEIISDTVFDEFGEPDGGSNSEWSSPIPCSIKTNKDNKKGKYEDGEFRVASFVILLEEQGSGFLPERIKLERFGVPLGEYRVQATEPLTTVGRLEIQV